MAGKVEVLSFDASPERVWGAIVQSVASLGYTVQHSDRESGALSFNTGRSMSSWGEKGKLMRRFAETVTKTLPSVPEPTPQVGGSSSTLADELAKIAKLRDSGVLSEEEFASAKRRLISGS